MKETKKSLKNSALYCVGCSRTTKELEEKNLVSIRLKDPYSQENITICGDCIQDLKRRTYTEGKKITLSKRLRKVTTDSESDFLAITPKYLHTLLSSYVVGQERAKRALALAVATHLRRQEDPSIEKSNILLLGPSGTGKTELARAISQILKVPFVVVDATVFTAHGYVGEDVESILYQLLQAANGDVALAEQGIVFIDEFDKLAGTSDQSFVNTIAVQQSLLKMIEGGKVKINRKGNKKDSDGEVVILNTNKILFICAGAFSGLNEIIRREKFSQPLGLGAAPRETKSTDLDVLAHAAPQHLLKFGIIQEILGRLPVITSTVALTETDMVDILTEPQNALTRQYQRLLAAYGVTLEFTPGFLKSVAQEAMASGIGARGLRSVMEKRLEPALFEGPELSGPRLIVAKANGLSFNPQRKSSAPLPPTIPVEELSEILAERRLDHEVDPDLASEEE